LVAEATPSAFRGSAFGLFNFTSGVAILFASLIAGLLWDIAGAKYTFMTGAVLTFIGLVGMLALIDGAHARPKLN
jgi:MFS family permease